MISDGSEASFRDHTAFSLVGDAAETPFFPVL
jgi:hypothetical protein